MVKYRDFSNKLLDWYDQNARKLSWRITPFYSKKGIKPKAYKVWISEIMLQQTGVKTVEPYYIRFIRKWPTIDSLQRAEEIDILNQWSGLGYYRRARDLKACAEIVCKKYHSNFPKDEKSLQELPGIGKYTAAAILTIAYGIPAVVVDGNIERIITRLYEIKEILSKSKTQIYKKMKMISPQNRPGDFAQAMMDLGATICTPKNPRCWCCPVCNYCNSNKNGTTAILPIKTKKPKKILRKGYVYLGITKSNNIAMVVRPKTGLLGGMICPPSSEWTVNKYPKEVPPMPGKWIKLDKLVNHTFTHFDLELKVMVSTISHAPKDYLLKPFDISITNALPSVMKKAIILGLKNY